MLIIDITNVPEACPSNEMILIESQDDQDIPVVTKMFCGNEIYLRKIIALDARPVHDSLVSNLEMVKSIDPKIDTACIKLLLSSTFRTSWSLQM
jgi:hypothetical protein